MALKIRLARGGAKKRPFYRIVLADSRMPRDGRFIERLGTYDPLLPRDREDRVTMNAERIRYWMERGAKPTDRVAKFLGKADVIPMPTRSNPQKAQPKAKAQERLQAAKDAAEAAAAAAAEPTAEEAPAEEPAAEAAPAEEAAADVDEAKSEG